MAKAEWQKFKLQAEAHVLTLLVNSESAAQIEGGRVTFKFQKEEQI